MKEAWQRHGDRLDVFAMAVAQWSEYLNRDISREEDRRMEELMEIEYARFGAAVFGGKPSLPTCFDNYRFAKRSESPQSVGRGGIKPPASWKRTAESTDNRLMSNKPSTNGRESIPPTFRNAQRPR